MQPETLEKKLNEGKEEFRTKVPITDKECKEYGTVLNVIEGREKSPEIETVVAKMNAIEKRDATQTFKLMAAFCKEKTETNWLNLGRFLHDKDCRTCRVTSNPYKQKFVLVRDPNSKAESWVVKWDKPEGPCGIVQLSRFEQDRQDNIVFWKYIARRAITNPQGKLSMIAGDMSCKDFDQHEYVYDWRSKDHTLGCDYIKFSVF